MLLEYGGDSLAMVRENPRPPSDSGGLVLLFDTTRRAGGAQDPRNAYEIRDHSDINE
jgi:hypothetical protein